MFESFDRPGTKVRNRAPPNERTAVNFARPLAIPVAFIALYVIATMPLVTLARAQDAFHKDATEAPVTQASKKIPPFTARQKFRFYWQTAFTPFAFTGPILGAAVTQWTTRNPPERGQGFPGYGRRVLSGYSRQVITNTVCLGPTFAVNSAAAKSSRGRRHRSVGFIDHPTCGLATRAALPLAKTSLET